MSVFSEDKLPKSFLHEIERIDTSTNLVTVRSNITNYEQCKEWIQEFGKITNTNWNFRKSRPSGKRFTCSKKYVCHHSSFHKVAAEANKRSFSKNSNCLASILMKVRLNTVATRKKDPFIKKGLLAVIRIKDEHNHSLNTAESLKFLPAADCRNTFIEYFNCGMNIAGARRYHERALKLREDITEESMANSRINPSYRAVQYWYDEWFKENLFPRSGKGLIDKGMLGVITINDDHNHPLNAAESLKCLPADVCKEKFVKYFNEGMGVAEACKHHRALLKVQDGISEEDMANNRINPTNKSVQHWFNRWRLQKLNPKQSDDESYQKIDDDFKIDGDVEDKTNAEDGKNAKQLRNEDTEQPRDRKTEQSEHEYSVQPGDGKAEQSDIVQPRDGIVEQSRNEDNIQPGDGKAKQSDIVQPRDGIAEQSRNEDNIQPGDGKAEQSADPKSNKVKACSGKRKDIKTCSKQSGKRRNTRHPSRRRNWITEHWILAEKLKIAQEKNLQVNSPTEVIIIKEEIEIGDLEQALNRQDILNTLYPSLATEDPHPPNKRPRHSHVLLPQNNDEGSASTSLLTIKSEQNCSESFSTLSQHPLQNDEGSASTYLSTIKSEQNCSDSFSTLSHQQNEQHETSTQFSTINPEQNNRNIPNTSSLTMSLCPNELEETSTLFSRMNPKRYNRKKASASTSTLSLYRN